PVKRPDAIEGARKGPRIDQGGPLRTGLDRRPAILAGALAVRWRRMTDGPRPRVGAWLRRDGAPGQPSGFGVT
ncbi:MAG: hypothetical protein ACK5PT_21425, partial [Cereibacter sp.]